MCSNSFKKFWDKVTYILKICTLFPRTLTAENLLFLAMYNIVPNVLALNFDIFNGYLFIYLFFILKRKGFLIPQEYRSTNSFPNMDQ